MPSISVLDLLDKLSISFLTIGSGMVVNLKLCMLSGPLQTGSKSLKGSISFGPIPTKYSFNSRQLKSVETVLSELLSVIIEFTDIQMSALLVLLSS